MAQVRVARILIDSPLPQLDRLFDYAVPGELRDEVQPGVRVRVPLRTVGRILGGYVVDVVDLETTDRPLSDVEGVVSAAPVLPERLAVLARRVADRAAGSASDVLRLVIPKRMVRAERAWLARGPSPVASIDADRLTAASAVLDGFPGLREAVQAGSRVAVDARPLPAVAGGTAVGDWAVLFAALAAVTLSAGRSVIVVVPDHRDLRQVHAALGAVVPDEAIVRDDAAQPAAARYGGYLRMLETTPCVVIGNRSAVYAPAHDVGAVLLWDDGDALLSEPLSPGVHARDAALVRQELEGSALVIAGHTRTTDVQRLVDVGWMQEVAAVRRTTPKVVLSATREGEGRGARVPSAAFAAARAALETGPVLVQVSRPGYAPSLVCADCRRPARCAHCTGPLRTDRPGRTPVCGWCGRSAHGWQCPHCASDRLRMASSGSERTADELGRAFPMARVIVADGNHRVDEVDARPALVVATRGAEPVAEGGYRAVLLLDADRMLMGDGLRVAEDCLRWWSNAAALAASDAPVHLVGVSGPVARALATWTQPAYARAELADRSGLRMPPAVRVASVEGPATAVSDAIEALREAVPTLAADAVLGPVASDEDGARALVRFEYGAGRAVTDALRAAVVAQAMRARRSTKRAPGSARPTLRVRVDVPDLDL